MTDAAGEPAPRRRPWLAAAIVLAVGGFLGFQVAYQSSVGGLGGALGAAFLGLAIGAIVLLAAFVGIINGLRPAGRGRLASDYSFAAAGLVLVGAVAGYVSVPVLDIGYHEPVVLQARGEASVTLEDVPEFEPRGAGRADCQSVAGGTAVERVVALSLGDLNGNVLRADIALPLAGISGSAISLFVDAAHLPDGTVPPMWNSLQAEVTTSSGGTAGTITFERAQIRVDPEMGIPRGTWPETLNGEVEWSCGPWFHPLASVAPSIGGRVTVQLAEEQWTAEPDALGRCEFEPDGSVWVFSGEEVGILRGRPMRVDIDLGGDPGPGDEIMLRLGVQEPAKPTAALRPSGNLLAATTGGPIVSWVDLVTLDEVSSGGLRGRLTFEELPREGTPNLDWPQTLAGSLTWACD